MSHLPPFGLYLLAFLFLCAVIAVAVWALARGGKHGDTKLSGAAGCLIGLALFGVAGLAGLAILFVALTHAGVETIQRGPVEELEFDFEPRPGSGGEGGGLRRVEPGTDPDAGAVDWLNEGEDGVLRIQVTLRDRATTSEIVRAIRDELGRDFTVSVRETTSAEGDFTVLEIEVPVEGDDMAELRDGLREIWPDFELPHGGRIRIREPR